jgi:exo-beta-1,3-glucanase (GH17 family)
MRSILTLLVLSFFIASCNSEKNDKKITDKMDENNMTIQKFSEEKIERESPFKIREIDPYINEKWAGNAISYGFYREGQAPGKQGPTKEEIKEDLEIILEHWNLIRIYNADDDAEKVLQVIKDVKLPIKVMIGVWLANEENDPAKKQENIHNVNKAVKLANEYKDILFAVSVGNETQVDWSAHKMDVERLRKYIRFIRSNTELPVTTADDYQYWVKDTAKSIADEIDFVTTHLHSTWNGQSVENAITWTDSIFNAVVDIYSTKQVIIGETGWPTNYNSEKTGDGQQGSLIKGEISTEAQKKYFKLYTDWIVKKKLISFYFEAFDEPWKGGGENTSDNEVEKHWGLFYENRTPKEAIDILKK